MKNEPEYGYLRIIVRTWHLIPEDEVAEYDELEGLISESEDIQRWALAQKLNDIYGIYEIEELDTLKVLIE